MDHAHEIYSDLRGLANMGHVISVSDSGQMQTVTVRTGDGVERADVQVWTVFGIASVPPTKGAICLLFALGADPANLAALPIAAPAARLGGLKPGEAALYSQGGSRFSALSGGILEAWAAALVRILAQQVLITAPEGLTVNANTRHNGNLVISGDISFE
jgi:phage gp45-like